MTQHSKVILINRFCFILQIKSIPFYVTVDKKYEAIVISIRGTLSLEVSANLV